MQPLFYSLVHTSLNDLNLLDMAIKNKSWKTTLFGFASGLIILALTAGLLFKLYNATDFAIAIGAILSVVLPFAGKLQKDEDKTGLPQ